MVLDYQINVILGIIFLIFQENTEINQGRGLHFMRNFVFIVV